MGGKEIGHMEVGCVERWKAIRCRGAWGRLVGMFISRGSGTHLLDFGGNNCADESIAGLTMDEAGGLVE